MINNRLTIFQMLAVLALAVCDPRESAALIDASATVSAASTIAHDRDISLPDDGQPADPATVIWPPLDQPLDLRGGYRGHPIAASRQTPMPAPETPGLSASDCQAVGAFILAGARARDRGVSARSFMARLRADLMKLGAEPADKRWFLHSEREARLLHDAAKNIFARPQAPATHYREFVAGCDAIRTSAVNGSRD